MKTNDEGPPTMFAKVYIYVCVYAQKIYSKRYIVRDIDRVRVYDEEFDAAPVLHSVMIASIIEH